MRSRPPEELLQRVPLWRGAQSLECRALSGGHSNESWLVVADGEAAVLRRDGERVPPPVVDRGRELAVLRSAAAAGLAPEVLFAHPGAGILVTHYLEGDKPGPAQIGKPEVLTEIAALLRRVHALPDPGVTYGLAEAGEVYLAAIRNPALRRRGMELAQELAELPAAPAAERRVCHMDPVAGNLIRTADGLRLLDWEFAVAGDPLFDVAAVIAYHDLGPAAALHLLRAWSGRVSPRRRQRLAELIRAYDALHWLWLAAGGDGLRERERVERRLAAEPLPEPGRGYRRS